MPNKAAASNAMTAYKRNAVLTANPTTLVVMLFDGLIRDLLLAKSSIEKSKIEQAVQITESLDVINSLLSGFHMKDDIDSVDAETKAKLDVADRKMLEKLTIADKDVSKKASVMDVDTFKELAYKDAGINARLEEARKLPTKARVAMLEKLALEMKNRAEHMSSKQDSGDMATAADRLVHAQKIVLELINSLDMKYVISREILPIYEFILNELMEINFSKDETRIQPLVNVAMEWRNTWKEVAAQAAPMKQE